MLAHEFAHELRWTDLPPVVQHAAVRHLVDTIGGAVSARQTELSRIAHCVAGAAYGVGVGPNARLWVDGRVVSAAGAALANGLTVDALDIHDGQRETKGHAGAAVIPGALAMAEDVDGPELLTTIVMGYEIAIRAGIALHQIDCDYHTSGSWNALGVAAMTARRLGLIPAQTREALGAAEFYGPRSQMMRVIDHPTMLKDGSGWGAMTGVMAGLLAAEGFTGAPAITVEGEATVDLWTDLGTSWRILDQYFKPVAVCRWAQPAIRAARELVAEHRLDWREIEKIDVRAFHEATRLWVRAPQDTEAAQYSLPFALAASLVHGRLSAAELGGANLQHPEVLALAERVVMTEHEPYNAVFPGRRMSDVTLTMRDGRQVASPATEAAWDPEDQPTDDELRAKFDWLTQPVLGAARASALGAVLWRTPALASAAEIDAVLAPALDTVKA